MDCIKFSETRKGEVRKTARKAYEKIFSETKAERKYYEDKKQKALRYLDKLIQKANDLDKRYPPFFFELKQLHRLVNDI